MPTGIRPMPGVTDQVGSLSARGATALPARTARRVYNRDVTHVQAAETPTGQRYMVVAAPPGSLLDAGAGSTRGGPTGGVVGVVIALFRAARPGWRIAVNACDQHGRSTGPAHRERVPDEAAAERRTTALIAAIREGRWPEPPSTATDG